MTIIKNILIPLSFCKYRSTVILFKFMIVANLQNLLYLLLHHTDKNGLTRSLKMLPQSLCMELSWFHLLIFNVKGVICKILAIIVNSPLLYLLQLLHNKHRFLLLSEDSLMFCAWNWGAIIKNSCIAFDYSTALKNQKFINSA